MIIPDGDGLADLGPGGIAPPAVPGAAQTLLWHLGLTRPQPAFTLTQGWDAEPYVLADAIDPRAGRAPDPGHVLNADLHEGRRFVVGEGRDIGLLRDSRAVFAPGAGLINAFNVGGVAFMPTGLLDADAPRGAGGVRAVADRAVERVPGLSIPLCHYGHKAFGHFVLDGLAQVWLFEDLLARGEARLVHWPLERAWMADLLDRCGAPVGVRRVLSKPAALLQRAGLSSALAGHGVYFPGSWSPAFFAWLRGKLVGAPAPASLGRVYVRRSPGDARAVLNQDALEAFLMARGFAIIDPARHDVGVQATMIAGAQVLVAPWGSGQTLAPLLGGRRRVIELTPHTLLDPWFLRQAKIHGLNYWPLIHPATPAGDIVADLDALAVALEAA